MYNPFTKELYQAVKDGGAFLNGRVLEASRTTVMEQAMVVSEKWKGALSLGGLMFSDQHRLVLCLKPWKQ